MEIAQQHEPRGRATTPTASTTSFFVIVVVIVSSKDASDDRTAETRELEAGVSAGKIQQ